MFKYVALCIFGIVCFIVLVIGMWVLGSYNGMVTSDESVKQALGQVENVYQRRVDLIPNLVEVVKGYASHEKETLKGVIEARAKATQVTIDPSKMTQESLQKFQDAQGSLGSVLSRLMVVIEKYPDLKANENFKELSAELAGTENRIAVERRKFNQTVQEYNTRIRTFPTSILAGIFGFTVKPYFESEKGADKAPKIKF